jgi:hypothetical protein
MRVQTTRDVFQVQKMNTKCKVRDCDKNSHTKGYCIKHYSQQLKYKHILIRTKYDKNKIIQHKDYAEIVLYNMSQTEVGKTKIDLADVCACHIYKWRLVKRPNGSVKAQTNINKKGIPLHQFLLKTKGIDHINGDSLDNRRNNLRVCTNQQNSFNQKTKVTNTSGYKGVSFQKKNNTYRAYIVKNNKQIHLGSFIKKEDAYKIRQKAEITMFGEYRRK